MIMLICGIYKEWYKWSIYITENTVTDVKNTVMVTGGKAGGEINWDMD